MAFTPVTNAQFLSIMPFAKKRLPIYADWLNKAMEEFNIFTPLRQAAFLAQLAHESGELQFVQEIADGKAYDTGPLAARLGNTPEADGDGQKWKGHCFMQITGHDNHIACAKYFGIAEEKIVIWLMSPEGACRGAGWFWWIKKLSLFADTGDIDRITRIINGGANGAAERKAYYVKAKKALGVTL